MDADELQAAEPNNDQVLADVDVIENPIVGSTTEALIHWLKNKPLKLSPGSIDLKPDENQMTQAKVQMTGAEVQMATLLLLWMIHAPRDLMHFDTVINNLLLCMEKLENQFTDDERETILGADLPLSFDQIFALITHLNSLSTEIAELPGFQQAVADIQAGDLRHPMRGRISSYPLYTCLMNAFIDEANQEPFLLLQGLVFIAHAGLVSKESQLYGYLEGNPDQNPLGSKYSSITQAGQYVRKFSFDDVEQDDMDFFSEQLSLREVYRCITERVVDRQGVDRPEYQRSLSPLFRHWLSHEFGADRHGGGGGKKSKHRRKAHGWNDGYLRFASGYIQETLLQDPDEHHGAKGCVPEVVTISGTHVGDDETVQLKIKEQLLAGLDLAENAVDGDLFLAEDTSQNPSARLLLRHQVNHVIKANQLLKTQWSHANAWEIAALLRLCDEIHEGKVFIRDEDDVTHELPALIMIMLWTGATLKEAVTGFRWVHNDEPRRVRISYVDAEQIDDCYLLIKPHTVGRKKTPGDDTEAYLHPRHEFFRVPDLIGLKHYIQRAFLENKITENGSYKLFRHQTETYRATLLYLLKHYLPSGHRLNEHKISMYLFNRMTTETSGDIADAILITGRYHPLGQTLLHYTSPSVERLQGLYKKTIDMIYKDLEAEGYQKPSLTDDSPDTGCLDEEQIATETDTLIQPGLFDDVPEIDQQDPDASGTNDPEPYPVIGSDFLPTQAAVQAMTQTLSSKIEGSIKSITLLDEETLSAIRDYHNAYSLYTLSMLGYATGYRAVKDPFLEVEEIDPDTGLAVISDKDGPELYNARLVWVPEVVRQQLSHYRDHVNRLMPILEQVDLNQVSFEAKQQMPLIFLLVSPFHWVQARPKTLEPLLKGLLPLPINVNRRFLRTNLRAQGCPAEVVDAFMGHWGRGQEPWGRHSSMSTYDLIEVLKPYIESLLQTLGYQAVRSRYQ